MWAQGLGPARRFSQRWKRCAIRWPCDRTGAWIVAASMSGALVFGLVNHFVIGGSDHVMHVAAEWRMLFGVTAALLVVSEAIGAGAGIWCAMRHPRTTGRAS